jgi:hypothetical protein
VPRRGTSVAGLAIASPLSPAGATRCSAWPALPFIAENTIPTPCHPCVIIEDGEQWVCGRCLEIPGLCVQCGSLFAAEYSLPLRGRPRIVADAVKTYEKYR